LVKLKTHFYKAINLNTRDIKKGYTYLYITMQHVLYRTNREEKTGTSPKSKVFLVGT